MGLLVLVILEQAKMHLGAVLVSSFSLLNVTLTYFNKLKDITIRCNILSLYYLHTCQFPHNLHQAYRVCY